LIQTAAAYTGPATRLQRLMRPVRSCCTRPARTSTWMCRDTACSEMSKGDASSETSSASPSPNRSRIARRTGSESAKKTRSSSAASGFSALSMNAIAADFRMPGD